MYILFFVLHSIFVHSMFCIALHVCTLYVLYSITCLFILCLVLHYVFVHSMSCLALHVCTFYDLYRILCLYILWLVLHYMFVHSMACIALHVCTFYVSYSHTHTPNLPHTYKLSMRITQLSHLRAQNEDSTTLTLTSSV